MSDVTDRLINHTQGEAIVAALQTIAQKSESPYNSSNKLNPEYIDVGTLADGMTTTTQISSDASNKLATTKYVHDITDEKQDSLTTEQLAAVNSGITVERLENIETTLDNKANTSTTYTKTEVDTALSGKQPTLTTAQLAAVNSGITSSEVTQIETNRTNISSVKDHYKYYNRTLFEQESIPTGTIAYGSTWIDGKAVRTYNQTTNIVGGVIEQGSWDTGNIVKIDSTTRCRLSNSITVQPNTTYTITLNSPAINNARVLFQYRDSNDYTSSESGWQSTLPYTFTTPSNCHKTTLLLSTVGDLICTPTDFGNLQINEGNTALSYEAPSWSTTDSEIITPALVECLDNGAKNLLNITSVDMSWATINADKSITVNYTTSDSNKFVHIGFNNLSTTAYVPTPSNFIGALLSGNDNTVNGVILIMEFSNDGTSWVSEVSIRAQTDKAVVLPNYPYCRLVIKFVPNTASGTYTFKPMICEKSLYDVSSTFEPYAMSNVALTKVAETNKNNILLIDSINPFSVYSIDEKIMTGTGFVIPENTAVKMPKGEYTLSFASNAATTASFVIDSGSTEIFRTTLSIVSGNNSFNFTLSANGDKIRLFTSSSCTITELSIVPKIYRDNGYTDYVTQALPNTIITPALVECVDNGAKNELLYSLERLKALNTSGTWSGNSYTFRGVTFTYNESTKEISTYGTSTVANAVFHFDTGFITKSGTTYVLSGCPRSGSVSGYRLCNMGETWANDFGNSATAIGDGTAKDIAIYVSSANIDVGTSSNPLVWKPMICEKSLYDVSPTYQPYALSNAELTAEIADIIDSTYGTAHNINLDTLTKGGRYLVNGAESSTSNAPFANWQTVDVYESNLDGYTVLTVQIATELGAGLARKFRRRTYSGGGQYSAWTAWTS